MATWRADFPVGQENQGARMACQADAGLSLAGLAWHARAYGSEQRHHEQLAYAAAERDARRRRIGLWAEAAPLAPWDFRRHSPARSAAAH